MPSNHRVLVIGLDSATFDLLLPWVKEGRLPTLAALLRDGAWGELQSTIPPHTAPAWSTFMTGKNPGKHGIFGLMKLSPDRQHLQLVSSRDRKAQDLWQIISENGKRVIVLNVPVTYPVRPVNGILISGFMTPPSASDIVYPKTEAEKLRAEVGGAFGPNVEGAEILEKDRYESLWNSLNYDLEARAEIAVHLLRREWDFFMIEFQGTDEVQHKFWQFTDPSHPLFDRAKQSKYGPAIMRYYEKVDEVLARILSKINLEDTTVIVVSDHGARSAHKWVSLNNLFWKKGLLNFNNDPWTRLRLLLFKIGITPISLYGLILKLHLTGLIKSIGSEETRSTLRPLFISLKDLDWSRTKLYSLGGWGQIYINESNLSQSERLDFPKKIIDLLLELKDEETGQSIFSKENIHLREEIYHGQFLDDAPDLTALPDSPYTGYADYEFGFNRIVRNVVGVGGTHAMNGILCMAGALTKKRELNQNTSLLDLAPTILYLLGLGIPEDMDGTVIARGIKDDYLASNPPLQASTRRDEPESLNPYTPEEEEQLQRRLKDLGYL